jgi:hypothetical protein
LRTVSPKKKAKRKTWLKRIPNLGNSIIEAFTIEVPESLEIKCENKTTGNPDVYSPETPLILIAVLFLAITLLFHQEIKI